MGYIALRISSAARNVGMPHLWEVFILKNVVLLDQIKVLPLLAGIVMGITQFIPEMTKSGLNNPAPTPGRKPYFIPHARVRRYLPISSLHRQLRGIPVGLVLQLPERSGSSLVLHGLTPDIVRVRNLPAYGVDHPRTRVGTTRI